MPLIVACPGCKQKLRVPDALLGKKFKCGGCGTMIDAIETPPAAEPPPSPPPSKAVKAKPSPLRDEITAERGEPVDDDEAKRQIFAGLTGEAKPARRSRDDDDEDERPARRRPRVEDEEDRPSPQSLQFDDDADTGRSSRRGADPSENLPRVHSGLSMLLWSIFLSIVTVFSACLLSLCLGMTGAARDLGFFLQVLQGVFGLILLTAFVLRVVGQFQILPSPREFSCRRLAVATLVLLFAHLGGVLLYFLIPVVFAGAALAEPNLLAGSGPMILMGRGIGMLLVQVLLVSAAVAGWVTFVLYMRSLGLALRNTRLSHSARAYLWTALASVVLSVVGIVTMFLVGGAISWNAMRGGGGAEQPINRDVFTALGIGMLLGIGVAIVVALVLFIWYIRLLLLARETVRTSILRRR